MPGCRPGPGVGTGVVGPIAFSPDSRVLEADAIRHGVRPGTYIVRWDVGTGRRLGRPLQVARTPEAALVGFTAGGARLVTSNAADRATVIRDAVTLRPVRRLPGGGTRSALSPNRRVVAFGGADGSVEMLDLRTGILRIAADRHDGGVTDLRFTSDSRMVLTAGGDGNVIGWSVADGRRLETFAGHAGAVSRIAIARDGHTVYGAGEDGTVIAWDLAGDRRLDRPFTAPPRGAMVVPSGERGTSPTDFAPGGISVPLASLALATTSDGRSFAAPDDAGYVDVFDSRTLTRRHIPVSPGTQVSAVALSPDGRTLAAMTTSGRLRFADPGGRLGPLQQAYHDPSLAWSLAFTGDGRWLATAGAADPSLRLWDVRARKIVSTSELSPYGRPGPAIAADVTVSPDSSELAAAVNDTFGGTGIDILTVPHLTQLMTLRAPGGKAVQFSPDGRLLAFGDAQGRVWLYDTHTWSLRGRPLAAHSGAVDTFSFSPDAKTLATTSDDGTTRLWDVKSGRPIGAPLPGLAQHEVAAALVDGGSRLVTLQHDGQGHLWDIQPSSWARRACQIAGRTLTRTEWNDALPERAYAPACSVH